MATRRHKRKKMTVTEKYTRVQTGLKYFGVELKELKKATTKALKAAQKIYKNIRKQLKDEGITELPSITQLAKEVIRRELAKEEPKETEREPLPYADENETLDYNTNYPIVDQFKEAILNAIQEVQVQFGDARLSVRAASLCDGLTQMDEMLSKIIGVVDLEEFAGWLSNSAEYERFVSLQYRDSDETSSVIGEMYDALEGIINDYSQYANSTPQFIPQHDINFDNI